MTDQPSAIAQIAMDETVIEDAEIESALETRWAAKAAAAEQVKAFQEADAAARGRIESLPLDVGPVRIGRFRIERKESAPRHVEFDAAAKMRVAIDNTEE